MINNYFQHLYREAVEANAQNIVQALKTASPHRRLLDVGCWDGKETLVWASAAGAGEISGIEPVASAAKSAAARGIFVKNIKADGQKWPFRDNLFDCIVSNQVVEHLTNLDKYFSESARTLKPGGYLITSTNNLSSLHNIFALIMGWAPFDLSNSSSKKMGIGNPLAVHRGESDPRGSSWTHKCVYTIRWLKDWQAIYGLEFVCALGAGFYPFPSAFGKLFPSHSAFITLVTRKKLA